ncbi:MAG: microviridin/marinostatin family tricyclic proteinase inhibitor [Hydrococcus sp. RM1_1_31]|nr:microviridin/marinostatin family tricyclic proteinase inhibitor [Hydrococcus sp. RM1_1_31]
MSEIGIQDLNSKTVPFFSRYLEGQLEDLTQEELKAASGGTIADVPESPVPLTQKSPSSPPSHGDTIEDF